MPDVDDIALLREYVDSHSESAFAVIVQRRVNLVYSVALRFTGNSEDAQDVTQAVFVILAKKAAGLRPNSRSPLACMRPASGSRFSSAPTKA